MSAPGMGRGRGMTLPAWMTQGTATSAPELGSGTAAPGMSESVAQPVQPTSAPAHAPAATPAPAPTMFGYPPPGFPGGFPGFPGGMPQGFPPMAMPAFAAAAATVSAPPATTPQTSTTTQPPAATTTPTQTPAPAKPSSVWTEHTAADGRKYYYNSVTRQSSWSKPADLNSSESQKSDNQEWKEYTTDDGRKYYHNPATKQTVWKLPESAKAQQTSTTATTTTSNTTTNSKPAAATTATTTSTAPASAPAATATTASTSKSAPTPPIMITSQSTPAAQPKLDFATKEEAVAAFKDLLRSAGVGSDWAWDHAMRAVMNDKRYGVLSSLNEKKAAFTDYISQRKREEREERRQKELQARAAFTELLAETTAITPGTTYRKIVPLIESDPRFEAVPTDEQRFEMFEEHMDVIEKQEKENQRAERKQKIAQLKAALAANRDITVTTPWSKAQEMLSGETAFETLDSFDRLTVFESHLRDLEKRQREEEELSRQAARRMQRKNRDAFRQLVAEMINQGQVTGRTRWVEFVNMAKEESRFFGVVGQPGSTPRELFKDMVQPLKQKLHQHKKILKDLLRTETAAIGPETTEEELVAILRKHNMPSEMEQNAPTLLKEFQERGKKRKSRDKERDRDRDGERSRDRSSRDHHKRHKGTRRHGRHSRSASRSASDSSEDDSHKKRKRKDESSDDDKKHKRKKDKSKDHKRKRDKSDNEASDNAEMRDSNENKSSHSPKRSHTSDQTPQTDKGGPSDPTKLNQAQEPVSTHTATPSSQAPASSDVAKQE